MGIGKRDAFLGTDYFDGDEDIEEGFKFPKRRRKKKPRTRRNRHKIRVSPRRKRHIARRGKKRGMSKEFLRKLRKKHHLGEFKK